MAIFGINTTKIVKMIIFVRYFTDVKQCIFEDLNDPS